MQKKILKSALALSLAFCVFFSVLPIVSANTSENTQTTVTDITDKAELYYSTVLKQYSQNGYKDYKGERITFDTASVFSSEETFETSYKVDAQDVNGIVWDKQQEKITFNITVQQEGLYNIGIFYRTLEGSGAAIQRKLLVNGKTPFEEAENIEILRFFKDTNSPLKDDNGDEVKPFSEEFFKDTETYITDRNGKYNTPLKFFLNEGQNEITFEYIREPILIYSIFLDAPKTTPTYAEVMSSYDGDKKAQNGKTLEFEAEDFDRIVEKNSSVVGVESSGDPSASPVSLYNIKMNYLGGAGYSKGNQSVTWKFTVKKTGFYKLGLRISQWYNDGLPVFRQLLIDDEIPFAEMECYRFDFNDKWYSHTIADDNGEAYLFWLDEGEHTITLTAKIGEYGVIEESLYSATKSLSALIRKVKMITGEDPDNNYDYEIDKNIPGIKNELAEIRDVLLNCEKTVLKLAAKNSSISNSFASIAEQLDQMVEDTDRIPKRLTDLETALGNLGDWINSIKSVPLGIDKFWIASPDEEIKNYNAKWWQNIYHAIVKLIVSFTKDYQSVSTAASDIKADVTLNVWVGKGTEWCQLIKQLSDATFTPESKINIKINTLPSTQLTTAGVNSLILSVAAGTAPDVVLGSSSGLAVEYAVRNAVIDLSSMEGFEETKAGIYSEAFKPLEYNGKTYALPETVSFRSIYYRTDVFEELGITPPDTWDDFYNTTLPVLYQSGLKCYIPMIYDAFLFQNGGAYYSDDGHFSALDTQEAFTAFKQTCELYTNYSIPVTANYFTQFRTGEMPMIIGTSADYLSFTSASPEIAGNWDIAPIPATVTEDGLNRSSSGLPVDCSMIMEQSQYKDEAWEFLKWWMSDETQIRFANGIESQLGITARYFSANKKAFAALPFSKEESAVINTFFENNVESKIVLGGYYTSRHIQNAWIRCVESGMDLRSSLEEAVEDINIELKRKQQEYDLYVDSKGK